MSDTPRTDKEALRCNHCWKGQAVSISFSSDMELKLNASNKRIEELEGAINKHKDIMPEWCEDPLQVDKDLWKIIQ